MRVLAFLILIAPLLSATPFNWVFFHECGVGVACEPVSVHNFGTTDYRQIQPYSGLGSYFDSQWVRNVMVASNHSDEAIGFASYGTGYGTVYGSEGQTTLIYASPDSLVAGGGDINEKGMWFVHHVISGGDPMAWLAIGTDKTGIFNGYAQFQLIDSWSHPLTVEVIRAFAMSDSGDLRVRARIKDPNDYYDPGRIVEGIITSEIPEPATASMLGISLSLIALGIRMTRRTS